MSWPWVVFIIGQLFFDFCVVGLALNHQQRHMRQYGPMHKGREEWPFP
jgi:hypothetical protein